MSSKKHDHDWLVERVSRLLKRSLLYQPIIQGFSVYPKVPKEGKRSHCLLE